MFGGLWADGPSPGRPLWKAVMSTGIPTPFDRYTKSSPLLLWVCSVLFIASIGRTVAALEWPNTTVLECQGLNRRSSRAMVTKFTHYCSIVHQFSSVNWGIWCGDANAVCPPPPFRVSIGSMTTRYFSETIESD